jgi:hypothetical protein
MHNNEDIKDEIAKLQTVINYKVSGMSLCCPTSL